MSPLSKRLAVIKPVAFVHDVGEQRRGRVAERALDPEGDLGAEEQDLDLDGQLGLPPDAV